MSLRKGGAKVLEALVENSPDPLAVVHPDGRVECMSGALLRLLGTLAPPLRRDISPPIKPRS